MPTNDQSTNLTDPTVTATVPSTLDDPATVEPVIPQNPPIQQDQTILGSNDSVTFPSQQPDPVSTPSVNVTPPATDTSILNPNPPIAGDGVGPSTPASGGSDDTSVVTSSHVPQKYGGKKVIATIFSVLFIIGAVVAGVTLVQRQQLLQQQAHEDHKITICHVPPGNPENAQEIEIDKNAWEQGHDPHNAHSLDFVINDADHNGDDDDTGRKCPPVTPTPNPTSTPTPAGTSTPTPTQVPGVTSTPTPINTSTPTPTTGVSGISAQCNNVVAYDSSGVVLSQSDLSNLSAGDKVTFAVSGQTNSGTFSKARFSVNGTSLGETTTKNSKGEYTVEYTIPTNTTTFSVKGEVYHSSLGWI